MMKKMFKGLLAVVALVVIIMLGTKAVNTYEYYAKLDALEHYVDVNYGEECRVDFDNLVINERGFMTNVLDENGEHVDFMFGYYKQ